MAKKAKKTKSAVKKSQRKKKSGGDPRSGYGKYK